MRILSSTEARLVDENAMTHLGISGESLMGRAGLAVAEKAKKMLSDRSGKAFAILCGKGNNGGDGYAAAVGLNEMGAAISLFSMGGEDGITGDARIFHDRCVDLGLRIQHDVDIQKLDLSGYDLVIDGLLGTGVKGKIKSEVARWIQEINKSESRILAIDIPSGISSDSGQILGTAVKADATVTMGFLKQGLIMNPGADYAGDLVLAEIGYPDRAFDILDLEKDQIEESAAEENLKKPLSDTYKHRQGKVLVLAGSKGYTGAACLAAESALRAGAGLVIAGVPESLNSIFESKLTEVITAPLPDDGTGRFIPQSMETLQPHFEWCDVIAIGPGLGRTAEVRQFTRMLFETVSRPLIIDADGLLAFQDDLSLFKHIKNTFIITPHYGEAAALFNVEKQEIVEDPFLFAHEHAKKIGGVLVLKGAPTLVADGETVAANTTGHQGLATGGSGDVLTGIIAGLRAQGLPPSSAAQVGVFIHGKAADLLLESHGYRGMIAGDLMNVLPKVISNYEHT